MRDSLWGARGALLFALAVGFSSVACGDDDAPVGSSPDSGQVNPDAEVIIEDTGVVEADTGVVEMDTGVEDDPSTQIVTIRTTPVGPHTPALPVNGAWVTYIRPAIGNDPAGFFIQAEQAGPALFIAVDPTTLSPQPVVGDEVSLSVSTTVNQDGQIRATDIANYARMSGGNDVRGLIQDVSMATDIITALDDYDSELVTVTATLSGTFGFAGSGHQSIRIATAAVNAQDDLRFRVVSELIETLGLLPGCVVNIGPTPMWRFNAQAQPSAWRAEDVSVTSCANLPQVVGARATTSTTVEITFNRPVDAASVEASRFTFVPALTVNQAAASGRVVTLVTDMMPALTNYTVTVDPAVTDDIGAGIDPNNNTASFTSPGGAPMPMTPGVLVINEIMQNPAVLSDNDGEYLELYNTSSVAYSLDGCVISDNDSDSHTIQGTVVIAGQGYATLARTANPGFTPDYVYNDYFLANSADEIVVTCGGVEIDRVEYAGGFPLRSGASMNLDPARQDATSNDMADSWCESTSSFNGDRGTPNAPNDPCAQPDAGVSMDAGMVDSGTVATDGGPMMPDAGMADMGVQPADTGVGIDATSGDATVSTDASSPDATVSTDASSPDATVSTDASTPDATVVDAGSTPDATVSADASTPDAAVADAGSTNDAAVLDTGVSGDAGPTITNPTAAGQLVITEIMQNPATLTDSAGEWFELYNATGSTFDLDGCVISDDGADSHTVNATVIVAPGAYVTFSVGSNPGFTPDYTYSGYFLANGADEVIVSCGGVEIDRVNYDNGATFPDPTGASMNLDPGSLDAVSNNAGGNWCEGTSSYNGDLGTPGAANDSCGGGTIDAGVLDTGVNQDVGVPDTGTAPDAGAPIDSGVVTDVGFTMDVGMSMDTGVSADATVAQDAGSAPVKPGRGDVIITEIMQNPRVLSDSVGEWFELYNSTSTPFDIGGCFFSDANTDNHQIAGSVIIPAGAYIVVARTANPGFTPDYVYGGSGTYNLNNSSDTVRLSCITVEIDAVSYDNGATFPDPNGASMNLDPARFDDVSNDSGSNWCEGTLGFNGDFGTPGAANTACASGTDAGVSTDI